MAARLRASALFLVLTVGCSASSPTQPSAPPFGEPFELRAGQHVMLDDGLRVSFLSVHADSRCPLDAICVRAGDAVVLVALSDQSAIPGELALSVTVIAGGQITTNEGVGPPVCSTTPGRAYCYLSTAEGKTKATTRGHTIELVRLTPHPRAATPIQPGEYTATFVVSPR